MQQVNVRRLDGSQFQAIVSQIDLDQDCAVVQHQGQQLVIICIDGTWRQVEKYSRGDQVAYQIGSQAGQGEVIHVVEASSSEPLVYIILPAGSRVPTVATPREVVEPEEK